MLRLGRSIRKLNHESLHPSRLRGNENMIGIGVVDYIRKILRGSLRNQRSMLKRIKSMFENIRKIIKRKSVQAGSNISPLTLENDNLTNLAGNGIIKYRVRERKREKTSSPRSLKDAGRGDLLPGW